MASTDADRILASSRAHRRARVDPSEPSMPTTMRGSTARRRWKIVGIPWTTATGQWAYWMH